MDRHRLYEWLADRGLLASSRRADPRKLLRPAVAIVAAAGRGSRLNFAGPKVLYPVAGTPILLHVYRALRGLVRGFCLVVSPDGRQPLGKFAVQEGLEIVFAVQDEPRGMGDAVLCAETAAGQFGSDVDYVVVWGDQATLSAETVAACLLYHQHCEPVPAITFATCRLPAPYIHFDRGPDGRIIRLLQKREGDVMPAEGETDCGVFVVSGTILFDKLRELRQSSPPGRATNEFNFLPLIPWLAARGFPVHGLPVAVPLETVGINTREDEARVARQIQL